MTPSLKFVSYTLTLCLTASDARLAHRTPRVLMVNVNRLIFCAPGTRRLYEHARFTSVGCARR